MILLRHLLLVFGHKLLLHFAQQRAAHRHNSAAEEKKEDGGCYIRVAAGVVS